MSKFKVQSNKGPCMEGIRLLASVKLKYFSLLFFFSFGALTTDLMSRILSSSNHMNLATLDTLHGKGLM